MKRFVALLLCVAMIFVLVGCSGGVSSVVSANSSSSAASAAPASDGKPVYVNADAANMTGTVRFWTAFDGKFGTDQLIEDFNRAYPNVKVEYTVYKNDTEGNVTADTALLSQEVDVILSFDTTNTVSRYENGLLMDLTDRLAADNLDLVTEWGTDAYVKDGRAYVLPAGGLSIFVAINMDMWNEANLGALPTEWTWDEYIEACRAMTKKDSSGDTLVYGGTDHNKRDYWTYPLRQTKGVDAFYNKEGGADFDNPLCATILNRQLAAEAEGVWYPKINLITDGTLARNLLWQGSVASCIESIITRFVMDTDNYPHDFILGYAPYPVNEKGETNYALGSMTNDAFFGVSRDAQDADAAYTFAKFAATVGSKYLYKSGHTSTWTGIDSDEIVDLVFGSRENAEKFVDVDSYIANVLAVGQPAYHEENVTAYTAINTLLNEYTDYILSGEMTVENGLSELNKLANEAIADAS